MAPNESFRRVRVDVSTSSNTSIGGFGQKGKQRTPESLGLYVSVELSESELKLKGELFVAAVRQALNRTFGQDQKVMVSIKNQNTGPTPITQTFGYMLPPQDVKITDQWSETRKS